MSYAPNAGRHLLGGDGPQRIPHAKAVEPKLGITRLFMRIGLLEIDQLPSETPKRLISKKKAHSLIERGYAKWVVDQRVLQMARAEQLIRLDYRYLRNASEPVWIPFNRPREWKECLLLTYPHKSQESKKFAGQAGVNEWFGC